MTKERAKIKEALGAVKAWGIQKLAREYLQARSEILQLKIVLADALYFLRNHLNHRDEQDRYIKDSKKCPVCKFLEKQPSKKRRPEGR